MWLVGADVGVTSRVPHLTDSYWFCVQQRGEEDCLHQSKVRHRYGTNILQLSGVHCTRHEHCVWNTENDAKGNQ
jgi:hypothetical protein